MRDDDNNRKRVQLHVDDNGSRYQGGHDGNGHLHAKASDGQVVFVLDIVGNKHEIASVDFFEDPDRQLSYTPNPIPPGTTAVQIHDLNTKELNARYRINVRAKQDGRVFACDPMISNEPRGR